MKLVRYGPRGAERPGLIDAAGGVRDLSALVADIRDDVLSDAGLARLAAVDPETLPLVGDLPRLGTPVAGIGTISLGIGHNYRSHAAEIGATPGSEPLLFSKAVTALSGPADPIIIPRGSVKTDWRWRWR